MEKGTDTNEKEQSITPKAQTVQLCPATAAQAISSQLASRMQVYVVHVPLAILTGFHMALILSSALFSNRVKFRVDRLTK